MSYKNKCKICECILTFIIIYISKIVETIYMSDNGERANETDPEIQLSIKYKATMNESVASLHRHT